MQCIIKRGSKSSYVPQFQIFSASGTFNVQYTGEYRITAIGAGADGYHYNSQSYNRKCDGGCGGGGYLETRLVRGESLLITIGQSASVSKDGITPLITATAGGNTTGSSPAPKAGSVSGTGVIAFISNDTATKSVIAPTIFADRVSAGGQGGYSQSSRDSSFTLTGSSGGSGLFGGDGGAGGSGYAYSYSSGTFSGYFTGSTDGFTGGNGAGNGGSGLGTRYSYSGTSGAARSGGSGGGGGYGGGGGQPWSYDGGDPRYYFGGEGHGGAACVVIERIV